MNRQNTGIQLVVHQIDDDGDDDIELNPGEDKPSGRVILQRWQGRLSGGVVEAAMIAVS